VPGPSSRSSGPLDPQWQQRLRQLGSWLGRDDAGSGDRSGEGVADDKGDGGSGRGGSGRGGSGRGNAGHGGGPRMPRFVAPLREQMHDRRYEYVPETDDVRIDLREHVVTLAQPLLRTVVGVLALLAPHRTPPIAVFALLVALIIRRRQHLDLGQTALVGVVAAVAMGFAGSRHTSGLVHAVLVLGLLAWLVTDVFVWYDDRLVVTNRRIYRVYGVFTKHGPSIALSSITFIDVELPPMGQAFNYGTLVLDSAAQRDDPLSHFAYLPDAVEVHKRILALRSAAIRTLPRPQDMI